MKTTLHFLFYCFLVFASFSCKKELVKPAGLIMLVNNSSNPYDVFVNGKLEINDMPGGAAYELSKPVGYYAVRVIQVSGYMIYPTDVTYSGDLSNNGTLVVSFPD